MRDIPDRLEKPAVVEPVDPSQRRALDGFQRAPRAVPADHLGFGSNWRYSYSRATPIKGAAVAIGDSATDSEPRSSFFDTHQGNVVRFARFN